MQILTFPAFRDNYIFAILNTEHNRAAVVDPGEATEVLKWLASTGASLETILLTHHHHDHTGGVAQLLSHFPDCRVVANHSDPRIPFRTNPTAPGDSLSICGFPAAVLDLAAHTRHHVAFYFPQSHDLFSGDTLFAGTCGNVFEGTLADMMQALDRIRGLPPQTRIWCAHEYTLMFFPDAQRLEPWNPHIAPRLARLREQMNATGCTIPLLLQEELLTNPFLHWDDPTTCDQLGTPPGMATFERIASMAG